MNVQTSVVIPSYNSEETIAACLESLNRQTFRGEFEVILCDSSMDSTREIACKVNVDIKIVKFAVKTDPGTARNEGIKISRGNLILFTDSDCTVAEDWVEKMVWYHNENPALAAVSGSIVNANDENDIVGLAGYMAEFRENIPQQPAGYIWHNPTCNISYKRSVFNCYGVFDPRLYPQEDLVFNYNLTHNGERILFQPDIIIHHLHRSDFSAFLSHQKRFGVITARVIKIIELPGSFIARHKALFILTGYLLPVMKFVKTIIIFVKLYSPALLRHPTVVLYLMVGMIMWYIGFIKGVFAKPLIPYNAKQVLRKP